MFDRKLSSAERAVQRKAQAGQRLNSDDRAVVQARLRATQRNHLVGRTIGVPSGAENFQPSPIIDGLVSDLNTSGRGLSKGGGWGSERSFGNVIPSVDFGPNLERTIRRLNTGNDSATFHEERTFTYSLLQSWKIIYDGGFRVGPLRLSGPGTAGSGGGGTSQGTTGGNASGAQSGSANSGTVSGGGSAPVSGATVSGGGSAGTANSTGGNTANSGGAQGGTTQSSGGANTRETYTGDVTANWTIRVMPDGFMTGLAHDGSDTRGTTANCGSVTFTVPVT